MSNNNKLLTFKLCSDKRSRKHCSPTTVNSNLAKDEAQDGSDEAQDGQDEAPDGQDEAPDGSRAKTYGFCRFLRRATLIQDGQDEAQDGPDEAQDGQDEAQDAQDGAQESQDAISDGHAYIILGS